MVAEPVPLAEAVAAYVAADTGPVVTIATARRWAAEAAADAYERGWDEGRVNLIGDEKRAQVALIRLFRESAPVGRWLLLCGPCRRNGRRVGCRRCQNRTRETFGQPHEDDFTGKGDAA